MLHTCCYLVTKSCLTFCNPINYSLPGVFCSCDFPDKNTGVDCCFLLQGTFLIQGSNLHLLHGWNDSLLLSNQGRLYMYVYIYIYMYVFMYVYTHTYRCRESLKSYIDGVIHIKLRLVITSGDSNELGGFVF